MLNLGLRGQILGTIIFVRMLMLPISHPSGHQITARYTSQSHPCASANLWLIDGLTYSLRLPLEIASPSVPAWPCFVMRTDKTSQPWLGCWLLVDYTAVWLIIITDKYDNNTADAATLQAMSREMLPSTGVMVLSRNCSERTVKEGIDFKAFSERGRRLLLNKYGCPDGSDSRLALLAAQICYSASHIEKSTKLCHSE